MRTILLTLVSMMVWNASAQTSFSKYIQAVDEYVPAPGQFINTMPEATEGDTPESMAAKCTACLAENKGEMVCLGAFGGYITFHFDHPVVNVKGEYDLYLKGNSYEGNAEPGIVMVSQDTNNNGVPDDEWYELSGSADVDSVGKVVYGYEITYTYDAMKDVPWTDNQGNSGVVERNNSHKQEYFPLWLKDNPLTLRGTLLPKNAVDKSGKGTYWTLSALRYGYVDNIKNTDSIGNSFKIDWAVDSNRQPVILNHIDFVRVYCAMNQQCGWIGETSTEFAGAEDLHLSASIDYMTGIDEVQGAGNREPIGVYTIDGKPQNGLARGIYIIRYSDGTVKKIIK